MKRFLLSIAAVLACAATNAQIAVKMPEQAVKFTTRESLAPNGSRTGGLMAKTPKRKAGEIASNQRLVSADGADNPFSSFGFPGTTDEVGILLSGDELKPYAGCNIVGMRFAFASDAGACTAFVAEAGSRNATTGAYDGIDKKLTKSISSSKSVILGAGGAISDMNWNYVTFDNAYAIPDSPKNILFGFKYTQKATTSGMSYTDDCYPLLLGVTSSYTALMAYGPFNSQVRASGWYPLVLSDQSGQPVKCTVCAQLIVENPSGYPKDIVMVGMIPEAKFAKDGGSIPVFFGFNNTGSETVNNTVFSASIDGNEVSTISYSQPVGDDIAATSADIPVNGIAPGQHTLSIKVKSMDGGAPTGDTDDDELSTRFSVYTDNTSHQHTLVEHFTGQECGYCPNGYDFLTRLTKKRGDIDWVAMHNSWYGTQPDEFEIENGDLFGQIAANQNAPMACFNRYMLNDANINEEGLLALSISVREQYRDEVVDLYCKDVIDASNAAIPAQLKLDLATDYNKSTGALTLTVSGTGVNNAAKVLADAALTVYLTEDGLTGKQHDYNGGQNYYQQNFEHRNVLRQFVSSFYGDPIVWNGDNFQKTYSLTIPSEYTNELKLVAFVGTPFLTLKQDGQLYANGSVTDWGVNQCNSIVLQDGQHTGVKGVDNSAAAAVVARYAADGTRVSAPVKGLNILKMSDGTTRKVMVNE